MTEAASAVSALAAGQRVRLKSDPARVGVLTGQTVERRGLVRREVSFPDGTEFVPELALEPAPAGPTNPYAELASGRFRRARDLRVALTYFRLSGRLAELIYSLNTTNTEFFSYQFRPVLSFLDSPARGLLIADEVGLGKTIEAGLIWTELRSRDDARRLLVLCPAMLRVKWQRELLDKFGVDAEICDAAGTLSRLEEVAAGRRNSFAIVASLQGLRPPAGWQETDEETGAAKGTAAARLGRYLLARAADDPLIDLVVIDEAHYLRNPDTQTARLGRLMRAVTENVVLLSATPIQLRSSDLFHLLNLLDPDTFRFEWSFNQILEQNAPLVALRDRVLREPVSRADFVAALADTRTVRQLGASSVLEHLVANPPTDAELAEHGARVAIAERLDRINPLARVVNRTRKRDVQERRVQRKPLAIRAPLSPVEEVFYTEVTARVREYCQRLEIREGFLLTIPQRALCSSMAAACRSWTRRLESAELDELLQEAFADLEALNGEPVAAGRASVQPLVAELARIAHRVGDFQALRDNDSKFARLSAALRDYWDRYPDAKVVLFSYFRETLRYLGERFGELGVPCALLMGGMDKDAVLDGFAAPDGARLLLSSEVASEGVDLQFSSLLVNYDLPWNPMRVEQRIGRIDRIGQKAERILIWNLFHENTLDDRVYTRLLDRLHVFEQALGSTESVVGDPVRTMSYELLRHHLTAEEEAEVIEQTRLALVRAARDEEELEKEASRLIAHGAYLQLKIEEARQLHRFVTGDDLLAYVRDFFVERYPGSQFITRDAAERLVEVELTSAARAEFLHHLEVTREQGRTRLATPASGRVLCRFDNRLQHPQPGRELVTQYHPVVRFVTGRLRESEGDRMVPVTALELDRYEVPGVEAGSYAFAVQRWSFSGERDVERLAYAAAPLAGDALAGPDDAERLVTLAALQGSDWVEARGTVDGAVAEARFGDCVDSLDDRYASHVGDMERESHDRIELQLQIADRHDANRRAELQGRIDILRAERKLKAVQMFEAQLRKHVARSEDRRAVLERRRRTTHSARLVACGVIHVR